MDLPVQYDSLTTEQRRVVREEYVRRQGGKCQFCNEPLDGPPHHEVAGAWVNRDLFPPNFMKWPIHLHHCHKTGLTIGAVHARCNAVAWQYFGE